jgi:hypothetical protein
MCKQCSEFVKRLIVDKNMTEEEAMDFIWEQTSFPFEAPSFKILEEINHKY